jgi:hypothetical protein
MKNHYKDINKRKKMEKTPIITRPVAKQAKKKLINKLH